MQNQNESKSDTSNQAIPRICYEHMDYFRIVEYDGQYYWSIETKSEITSDDFDNLNDIELYGPYDSEQLASINALIDTQLLTVTHVGFNSVGSDVFQLVSPDFESTTISSIGFGHLVNECLVSTLIPKDDNSDMDVSESFQFTKVPSTLFYVYDSRGDEKVKIGEYTPVHKLKLEEFELQDHVEDSETLEDILKEDSDITVEEDQPQPVSEPEVNAGGEKLYLDVDAFEKYPEPTLRLLAKTLGSPDFADIEDIHLSILEYDDESIENALVKLGLGVPKKPMQPVALSESDISEQITEPVDIPESREEIASLEYEPSKREEFLKYVDTLDPLKKKALLEAVKRNYGANEEIQDAIHEVQDIIKRTNESKLLAARQEAAAKTMGEYDRLAKLVSDAMKHDLRDGPLASLKIDGALEHIKKLNTQIMSLSTAVYDMAQELGLPTEKTNSEEMGVDLEALLQIIVTVKYGVRSWAAVHKFAAEQEVESTRKIKSLNDRLVESEEDMATVTANFNAYKAEIEGSILDSRSNFTVGNSVYMVTSAFDPDDQDVIITTPNSLQFTANSEEAIEFQTYEDAKVFLDQMMYWSKKSKKVKRKMKELNIDPNKLFIGQVTVRKV